MDPKVQKLIERALAENLTDARVSDIMYLNGYEQSAIDAALEELKKKRPAEPSPSASTQEETASMASPSAGVQDQQPQPSGSALPVGSPGRQVEVSAELARTLTAYAKGTLAYNTGADFTSSEDMLARNEEFRQRVATGDVREPGGSVLLKMFAEEEREQARELDRIRKEAEQGQMLYPGMVYTPEALEKTRQTFDEQQNQQRQQANEEINKQLGGNFNLYEDDGTGKLVANPEKKEVFDKYVNGLNSQAEYRINQFIVDEAKEKAQVDPVLMPYTSNLFQSVINVGVSTVSMLGEATGLQDEKVGDAISEQIRQRRLNNMYSAGIKPELGVTESLQGGDLDNAMKQILFAGTDFIPQIAAMIANPAVGFSYAAAGASSSTYDQYRNRLDLSATDKAILVGGSAVIELAMERLGIGDIKMARRLMGIVPGEVGTAAARSKALSYLTPLTKGFLPEFAEEGGVSLLNQALAATIAGEEFDVRAIIDEGLIGGVFGGTTVGLPQVLSAGMNGMASRARMKDFRAVTDRIAAIQEAMTNPEITQAEKDLLNNELVDLAMKQTAITNSSKEVYAGLDEKSQNELRQVHQDLNKAIEVYEKATDKTAKTLALRNVKMQLDAKAEIEARYDSKTQTGVRGSQQEGNFVGQVSKPGTGTKKTPPSGVVQAPETEIDPKFYQPEVEVDAQGRAIPYDPAKNDSDTFTIGAARPTNKLSEENASTLNRIFNVVSKVSEGAKVVVHHSLQSLLNSNAAALQMYTDGRGTPKAYYDPNSNQFHVMSMEAYQKYNEATGKAIEGEKQYMHEMSHPILDQLIEADAEVKERLFSEITALSEEGNEVAGRALRFGKGYAEPKQQMETIVEFFALMGDPARIDTLSESFIQKVKNLFNELLARIGMDVKLDTAQDVATMARNLHIAMKTGATVVVSKSNVAYQKRSLQFSIDDGTTPAGSRLFNTPLEGVQDVVQKYVQRAGIDYRPGKNITQLNEERAKEIGQAYDRMKHDPKDPEVKKAYDAMAKETIAQYEAILEEGYIVEINNQEPYANSADMIADLRDNKVMKIFSTESGFGDTPITDDQRAENPLLRDSGFKDVNGLPLLVNDVFRFVHDFFGHAERGNSFGAKGEENAWDAHSRMYSPLARKAMTTETRGQNSWVNFSGVNDEAFKLRDKARALRKEGRTEEAAQLVEQVYEIMRFADQKIGLLPDGYVRNDYDGVEFSLDQSFVIREGEDVKFRNTNPAMAKVREAVWAERVLEQNPMFNFNGTEKIESAADVAYLFRHLESAVSENAFVVFSNPSNGEYRVQWLGTGGTTSTIIDVKQIAAAYQNVSEQLGTDELNVTLVHNHPSGALQPSNADITILGRIETALSSFGATVRDGVIINLDSGKFSTFSKRSKYGDVYQTKTTDSPVQYAVQSFSRQELYAPSEKMIGIRTPEDVAIALSRLKRGVNEKLGYFVLNQANQITYSAILDPNESISRKVSAAVADVGRYGEVLIIFGNDALAGKQLAAELKEPMSAMDKQVLDVVAITNADNGILEARAQDGSTLREGIVGDIDFSLDDMPAAVADMPNGIKNAIAFASESAFGNKLNFKKALQERFAANESQIKKQYGIKSFKTFDQPLMDYLVDSYVNETLIAINSYPDALGWYDAKTKAAMGIMSLVHPELATDPVAEAAFKISVAVTSNGNKVFDNFKEADRQYRYYKKNGKFDSKYSIGTQSKGIKETFKFTNMILEKMSMENFAAFLTSKFNAGDLKFKKGGKNVPLLSGFTVDTEVYGASIFGAKIGNGFFMNLYGQFDQLTMDRWFMRQYGRLTGTLLDIDPVKIKNGKARLAKAVKSLTAAEKKVLTSVIPDFKGLSVVDLSHAINKASIVKEKRNVLSSTTALNESRKAGNSLSKNDSGEVEAPGGGRQRKFIVEVFNEVQRRLMQAGIDITIADLQAVNWYPEKALYQTFQEGRGEADGATETSDNEQPDYESAAKRLALDNGITENQIQNVTGKQRGESTRGAVARRAQQLAGDGARPSVDQLTQAILKVKSGETDGETYFSVDEGSIDWYESPEGKGDPAISRRDTLLEEAAQDLLAGRIKNYEFREMAKGLSPIEPITRFFAPATQERMATALSKDKVKSLNAPVEEGQVVALRLDIPAYTSSNTWVVSIHDGMKRDGKVVSYRNVARITDVVFKSNPLAALNIAAGEAKSTIGRMFGKFKAFDGATIDGQAESAKAIVNDIWNKPEWKQIGMNPTRASYFYDRKSGRPVVAAEEVVQIGGLVYAKNPVFTRWNDPLFEVKGYNDVDGAPIYFSIDDAKPEDKNLRRTIERTVNRFDNETRQRVLSNPESYMTKQSVNALKDQLSMMSDEELVENMTAEGLNMVSNTANPGKGENDISVLAAVELINRKAEAGEDVSELLVDLAKLGTTVGRMLRHFAELKSSTPLGIVETIRSAMKRANRVMTATQEQRLGEIAGRFITAQQKVKALRDELILEFDAAKEQELNKLTKELDAVTKELNKFTSILVPKKISDLLTTTIQGNLLTPISQVTNVFANLFQIGLSIPVRTAEIAGAKVYQMFTGKNLRSFRASISALPYAMKRGGVGFMEAIQVILKGGATTEKIVHAGFVPGAAFLAAMSDTKFAQAVNASFGKDVIKGDVLPRLANGKISAADRAKALYEGVVGVAPEIMFRFLALGDKPFSRFSEGMQMYQEAQKLGLKGEALRTFLKYPTKQAQKRAEQEGKKLTFQQDNAAASAIFQFQKIVGKIPTVGKALEFALKVSLPYVKTPANIFTETLMFAIPGIGFARGTHRIYKGETEAGISDLAKAATGQMIIMAANYLIANGLIKGAFTDEDDEERALAYLQQPPMTINRSGLERLLAGENPAWQPGDIVMRYDKMGIIGTTLGSRVTAINNNLAEAQGKEEGYYFKEDKGWFEPFTVVWDYMGVPLATLQTLNQQSFLAGSSSLLKVLSGGASERDVDDWIVTTFRALTAVPFPNTLSAFSRAEREYMPDSKAQTLEGKFKYVVMDRLLDTDGMPARVDFLGNKIPQNPDGANKWIYNFLDPMKTAKTSDDKLVAEIYRLYSLEENPDVIPGFPTKLREVPKKHPIDGVVIQKLSAERELAWRNGLEDLQVEYGQYVASRLESLFASDDYLASNNEDKVKRVSNMLADIRDGKMTALKSPVPGMKSMKRNYKWYNDYLNFADEFFSEAQRANP